MLLVILPALFKVSGTPNPVNSNGFRIMFDHKYKSINVMIIGVLVHFL